MTSLLNSEDVWFQFCKTEEELKKTAKTVYKAKLFDEVARYHYMRRRREFSRRKLTVLYVERRAILDMFLTRRLYPRKGYWLELDDGPFPDDVHVAEVYYNFDRNCFAFLLRSRRFSPVPHGEIIPSITGENLRMRYFTFPLEEAQSIVQYVITCRMTNTKEWMSGLVDRLNAYLEASDETDRVSFENGWITINDGSNE